MGAPSLIKICDGDAGPLIAEYEIMNEVLWCHQQIATNAIT
jgi:hypothetical protein